MDESRTTTEEVAEIIFNSSDSELNDMLQKAKTHNYDINNLVWRISVDINTHFSEQLAANSTSSQNRRTYLFKQMKSEFVYYAKWY
jgi:hypothetical protein